MATFDLPLEVRLHGIEDRLTRIEERLVSKADIASITSDLAIIKTKLESLPSRWMQWLFGLAIIMPLYGILVMLLWTSIHH